MQQHPLSAAFPAMSPAEFDALRDNIKQQGQRHPIITIGAQVLDGWHRMRACLDLGIDPYCKEYGGQDPAGYVLSSNLHRRHLSASQRAGAIVACNEWRSNGVRDQLGNVAELPKTSAQLAETAQVSERLIVDAKAAHKAGFGEAVRDGQTTASEAATLARKAPEVAARVVAKEITPAQGKAELKAKVKRELPTLPGPDLNAELDRMEAQIMDMRAELIELRAASHDEQLRAQARDEIAGLREALELEQTLHNALKAQRETIEYQLNDWKNRCISLEKQLARRERGE
jgi:ParB-like nuclease domain